MRGLSLHFHHPTKPNDDDQMIGFLDSLPCKTNVVKGKTVDYSSKKKSSENGQASQRITIIKS
jgi:hypothetical protein